MFRMFENLFFIFLFDRLYSVSGGFVICTNIHGPPCDCWNPTQFTIFKLTNLTFLNIRRTLAFLNVRGRKTAKA